MQLYVVVSCNAVRVARRWWWLTDCICVTQKNNRDFLNPIQFQLTQRLRDTDQPMLVQGGRLPDIDNFDINGFPVLNATLAKNVLSVRIWAFESFAFL